MQESFAVHIVDDDASVRESLKALVGGAGYEVHCYSSAPLLLERCETAVGCALVDLRLGSGMNGIELQRELIGRQSSLAVIMMSAYADVPKAVQAMRLGAVDFIEKPFDPSELLRRLQTLAITPEDAKHNPRNARAQAALIEMLTPREKQVLRGIVDGQANKEVAAALSISPRTVETHRVHIMQKLQAESLAHLVRIWMAAGQHSELPSAAVVTRR